LIITKAQLIEGKHAIGLQPWKQLHVKSSHVICLFSLVATENEGKKSVQVGKGQIPRIINPSCEKKIS
jgi:hypothetical protein